MTPSSTLDSEVSEILADTAHIWESFVLDGVPYELCSRCCRSKDACRDQAPDHPAEFFPCRGFT